MIRCRLGIHRWGLMQSYRLNPSIVHQVRCTRCGKSKP